MAEKNYLLTKSKYIRGLQCYKALFYDTYHKEWAVIDEATRIKFAEGRKFEKTYRDTFPEGIDISAQLGWQMNRYPALTQQLLQQPGEVTLFEAGFLYDDILVLADVVRKHANGSIDVYEIKNSDLSKGVFLHDIAIQHYVIGHNLPSLQHFFLVRHDAEGRFVEEDHLVQAQDEMPDIALKVQEMKEVLRGEEPCVPMGEHCDTPYECPYKQHCAQYLF